MYEVKKLETLLAMVREPDPKTDEVTGKSFIKKEQIVLVKNNVIVLDLIRKEFVGIKKMNNKVISL